MQSTLNNQSYPASRLKNNNFERNRANLRALQQVWPVFVAKTVNSEQAYVHSYSIVS